MTPGLDINRDLVIGGFDILGAFQCKYCGFICKESAAYLREGDKSTVCCLCALDKLIGAGVNDIPQIVRIAVTMLYKYLETLTRN